MRGKRTLVAAAFIGAAAVALFAANGAVSLIEQRSERDVRAALDRAGLTWTDVEARGMQVFLYGTAPTESLRFDALSTAGKVIDAARLADEMTTRAVENLAAPRFSLEVLRNASGLSLLGLIPAETDREALLDELKQRVGDPITDLMEAADYPAPTGWNDALAYTITVIEALPRSKISVDAGRVDVTAIADSKEEKTVLEAQLRQSAPPALAISLEIAAPRPVITPFTLRFVMDEVGVRFDACSADTEEARAKIIEAAKTAGYTLNPHCRLGMGAPTKSWGDAASLSIAALGKIEAGSVTMSDADISLMVDPKTNAALFDRVVGELENALPELFVLHAILPESLDPQQGPQEFVATLSPEGQVQLRGRLPDRQMRSVTHSFAKAKFGSENVYMAARTAGDLPEDWGTRVLAGIEALSYLSNGALIVNSDEMKLSGRSSDEGASDAISGLITEKLGAAASFAIDIAYVPPRPPADAPPTPEECEAELGGIVSVAKINFEPGSATIDAAAVAIMDDIAAVLSECGDLKLEVQGHTDSQGRESMNLALSQSRAESVLNELRARNVLTGNFVAKGYGEEKPIADNATQDGREANRRIEFRLILPEPSEAEIKTTLETISENGDTEITETAEQPVEAAE
ncbi:MAG: phosphate ABC transporter substrate-binding/OmpA family protein [Roseobacter sp.]